MSSDSKETMRIRAAIEKAQAHIDANPVNSAKMREAVGVINASKGASKEEVSQLLKNRGLPSLAQVSLTTFRGIPSLWWWNKRKSKLEAKLND